MNVLTLAAGLGSRLVPALDQPIPKALISLGSETILGRQTKQLSISNNTNHIVVIGSEGACWTNPAIEEFREIADTVVCNKRNAETEAAYSFLLGLQSVPDGEGVFVIDGDIILDDQIINSVQSQSRKDNVALVKATETQRGLNQGASISFNGSRISRCSFNVQSNYVYSGIMSLSPRCVEWLKQHDLTAYEHEQLATIIDEVARDSTLIPHTVNPETASIPLLNVPLDGYDGAGVTELERRKGRLVKRAKTAPNKLRDEIETLQRDCARHPNHFPKITDMSFFDNNPSYEVVDYTDRGYTPLDQLILNETTVENINKIIEKPIKFILEEYGTTVGPIPGLYKNAFLPKINTRYAGLAENIEPLSTVARAETVQVNDQSLPGLPEVVDRLKSDLELLGRLEPEYLTEVHGDFKPDNILIHEENGKFIIIDPRGRSEIGTNTQDPLYDLAKFLTSTQGYYTALNNGAFELSFGRRPEPAIEYSIKNRKRYERLGESALKYAKSVMSEQADAVLRVEILTALLLISNAPVQATGENGSEMATLELVRGLELFDRALEQYNSHVIQRGNIVNVNTESDLKKARELFGDTQ